ncbi:MAG: redoxin domain-containing protein [Planctomycetes bacterium]|nr:redoxin domain-containing protein [Planctomycetota bacterium]
MVLMLSATLAAEGQDKKKKGDLRREVSIKVGDVAPDFMIKDIDGKKSVKLSDLKSKPVVLIFGSCT